MTIAPVRLDRPLPGPSRPPQTRPESARPTRYDLSPLSGAGRHSGERSRSLMSSDAWACRLKAHSHARYNLHRLTFFASLLSICFLDIRPACLLICFFDIQCFSYSSALLFVSCLFPASPPRWRPAALSRPVTVTTGRPVRGHCRSRQVTPSHVAAGWVTAVTAPGRQPGPLQLDTQERLALEMLACLTGVQSLCAARVATSA